MLSLKVKCFIYKPIMRPLFTYGSETCVLSKQVENLLRSFERKVLRKIFGPVLENGYRRGAKTLKYVRFMLEMMWSVLSLIELDRPDIR
jgi:hypothetical protein